MSHFRYIDDMLHAEGVCLHKIAEEVGTPFYVYSTKALQSHYKILQKAFEDKKHLICFSVKAASNQAILTTLQQLGAGMDVVSGGEYRRAISAGVDPSKIIFSGVGKTLEEMELIVERGVRQVNIESEQELELLSEVALSKGSVIPITIRVNPDVDAKTHEKISTGKAENKFGIPISRAQRVYRRAGYLPGLKVVGIDVHIGSQLTELEPFAAAFRKVADLAQILRSEGHEISRLDLGGGLGIPYSLIDNRLPSAKEYAQMISREVGHLDCEIDIEPGRFIAGNAGILIASVIYEKEGQDRNFLIIDAAMNDLIRVSLYEGTHHDIIPAINDLKREQITYDVVGPVCETGDTFAKGRLMPKLLPNDLVAFRTAGAYGAVMASEYNSRPLIPEVMVNGNQFEIIRPRPTFEEIINRDLIPSWLK